ncbi:MAG TPA: FAD-binding oxidoreductase [Gemmatimonadaceae bacterium]|nr:FAD-binding oxidoreductase [Gemmatimonadaceae bacterium]
MTSAPPGFRGIFRDDELARAVYSEAAGIERAMPTAVAVPADAEDVVSLVKWAADTGTKLIPRGSGSSMAGGAIGNGVIVDLSRISHLSRIAEKARTVWADPGVLWSTLDVAAKRRGLRFPVDPSSGSFCTIGGMVATNASGAHTLRYGSTRAWVNAIDCVFSDGDRGVITRGEPPPKRIAAIARFMRDVHGDIVATDKRKPIWHPGVRKESSGYAIHDYASKADLVDLLVGSEGTLAIVVAVQLSLSPVPVATSSVLGSFASLEDAAAAATKAVETGASACELLDRTFLAYAAKAGSGDAKLRSRMEGAAAILLAEVEGDSAEAAASGAEQLATAFRESGAKDADVALTARAEREIWELRHAASPILAALEHSTSMQFIEDSAVPLPKLPDYVKGVRDALGAREVSGVIFGHAGDAHVHVNPLIDTTQQDWREKVSGLLEDVVSLTARLGGTLTGEHGDGRIRTPLLSRVWHKDAIRAFSLVKNAFDPANIFNPGVKVPLTNQRAINDIKYDSSLPPLPKEARAALDKVVSAREYNQFRLSLIGGPP